MSKNVQIKDTITGMSQSLDVIASNVMAGEYNDNELQEKLASVANVLVTTASAHKHLMGQVSDVDSFSTVASTNNFDETLSVVLSTTAQAQLIGQMIKGQLGITAEDEAEEGKEEEVTDEVQEAVSFEAKAEEDGEKTETPAPATEAPAKTEEKEVVPAKEVPAVETKAGDDKPEDEMSKDELTAKAMDLLTKANAIGTGTNHGEINPEVKQVEKKGANDVPKSDGNAPAVKTKAVENVASVTAMSSSASAQPSVAWNFN